MLGAVHCRRCLGCCLRQGIAEFRHGWQGHGDSVFDEVGLVGGPEKDQEGQDRDAYEDDDALHRPLLRHRNKTRQLNVLTGRHKETTLSGMNIAKFAAKYRLKSQTDKADDTVIIPGKTGHIYEYGDDLLGVIFVGSIPRARLWKSLLKHCLAAGMELRQNGDAEGALSFQADSPEQARLAIKMAGIRRKRRVSPEQIQRLAKTGFKRTVGASLAT